MIFFINAWLDHPNPFISVHNHDTGKEVVRFEQQELETHLAEGNLSIQDFCSANAQHLPLLIKELLLLKRSYAMSKSVIDSSSEDKLTNMAQSQLRNFSVDCSQAE